MNSNDFTIVPIETPTLGDRSYLVHDGAVAFVVDPQRDIDRVPGCSPPERGWRARRWRRRAVPWSQARLRSSGSS